MAVVYCATNIVNGKKYVGITTRTRADAFEKRKREHFSLAFAKRTPVTLFHRALRKYGWENFQWEIHARDISTEEAKALEITLIKQMRSFSSNGYNMTAGGDGTFGCRYTPEERLRRRTRLLRNPARRAQMLQAMKEKRCVPVIRNDGRVFSSVTEAASALLVSQQTISKCLTGQLKTVKGFAFKRVSEASEPWAIGMSSSTRRSVRRSDGLVFSSVREAARYCNLNHTNIISALKGRYTQCGGYAWEYVDGCIS